ncbi:MAG: hypothetical protein KJO79_06295, partial [Verrucomicrobiae bacterium]|nr:hypothetical protein [Verrucomicrobiae bacterium]
APNHAGQEAEASEYYGLRKQSVRPWPEATKLTGQCKVRQTPSNPAEPLPDDRACVYPLAHIKIGPIKNAPLVTTSDLAPFTNRTPSAPMRLR